MFIKAATNIPITQPSSHSASFKTKIQNSIEQAKITNKELSERNTPELLPPLRITAKRPNSKVDSMPPPVNPDLSCSMNSIHQCNLCGKLFPEGGILRNHINSVHNL